MLLVRARIGHGHHLGPNQESATPVPDCGRCHPHRSAPSLPAGSVSPRDSWSPPISRPVGLHSASVSMRCQPGSPSRASGSPPHRGRTPRRRPPGTPQLARPAARRADSRRPQSAAARLPPHSESWHPSKGISPPATGNPAQSIRDSRRSPPPLRSSLVGQSGLPGLGAGTRCRRQQRACGPTRPTRDSEKPGAQLDLSSTLLSITSMSPVRIISSRAATIASTPGLGMMTRSEHQKY